MRRNTRGWVVYFAALVVLGVAAVTLPIVYNQGQQLRPEQLQAAEKLWQERGPADYDLLYSIRYDRERLAERHIVLVRGGRVVFASCEGDVVTLAPPLAALVGLPIGGLGKVRGRDVGAIFGHIERLLAEQEASAGRNFLVAVFDPKDGHPRRLIRRVRHSSTREEWDVLVRPPGQVEEMSRR